MDRNIFHGALGALHQWSEVAMPRMAATFGMEDNPFTPYAFKKQTLKQVLKASQRAKSTPRVLGCLARHLLRVANLRNLAGQQLEPLPEAKLGDLIRKAEDDIYQWIAALESILGENNNWRDDAKLRQIAKALDRTATHQLRVAQKREDEEWQDHMREQIKEATAKAYRYIKGSAHFAPEGDLIKFKDESRAKWKQVWNGSDVPSTEEDGLFSGILIPRRSRLTACEIREAAKTFSAKTTTCDGWHPKMFAWLPDHHLDKLAEIMALWEEIGSPALLNQDLIVKLIPKSAGGYRPIGLFPSLARLYGKARQPIIRRWMKEAIPDPMINMASGRRVGDATWRHKILAIIDTDHHKYVLEGLWDVQKCFEHVNRRKLVNIAAALHYPVDLLAVSLSTYRWPRTLLLEKNIVTTPVWPNSGIAAGSPQATYELAAYTILAMRRLAEAWPCARLSLHADDLTFQTAHGSAEQAKIEFTQLAEEARAQFLEIDLPFAPDKACVIGNHQPTTAEARSTLGEMGGSVIRQARKLGYDFTLTRARSTVVQQARIIDAQTKHRRLQFVVKSRVPASIVFSASLKNGAIFGCDSTEVSAAAAGRLQAWALRAACADVKGAMHATTWAVIGTKLDPLCDIKWAPLERYHREWWMATSPERHDDVLSPPQLVAAFSRIDMGRCCQRDARRRNPDPISMAVHSAFFIGWQFINPTQLDIGGTTISILKISPAGLKQLFADHYQRHIDRVATQKLMDKIEDATGLPQPQVSPTIAWQAIRTVYNRFCRSKLRNQAKMLLRVVSAAVVTGNHMGKHKGMDASCTLCGHHDDNMQHRLYECPATGITRMEYFRPSLCKYEPVDTMEHATKYCGLMHIPSHLLQDGDYTTISCPAYPDQSMVDLATIFSDDFGAVYTDASSYFANDLYFARTAMAIVQVDVTGIVRRAWATTIPSIIATHAAYGEQMAAFVYASTYPRGHIVTDCAAVVSNIENRRHAAHPRNPLAGAWRQIPHDEWPSVTKTKAHRSEKRALADGDFTDWVGNRAADSWAKDAATRGVPLTWQRHVANFIQSAKELIAAHVVMQMRWPPPPEGWWKKMAQNSDNPPNHGGNDDPHHSGQSDQRRHRFIDLGSRRRLCIRCLDLRLHCENNAGLCLPIMSGMGHDLAIATSTVEGQEIIACRKCSNWMYGHRRRPWIAKRCQSNGQATRKNSVWSRVQRGIHPSSTRGQQIASIFIISNLPGTQAVPLSGSICTCPSLLFGEGFPGVLVAGLVITGIFLTFLIAASIFVICSLRLRAHISGVGFPRILALHYSSLVGLANMPAKGSAAEAARNAERRQHKMMFGTYRGNGSGHALEQAKWTSSNWGRWSSYNWSQRQWNSDQWSWSGHQDHGSAHSWQQHQATPGTEEQAVTWPEDKVAQEAVLDELLADIVPPPAPIESSGLYPTEGRSSGFYPTEKDDDMHTVQAARVPLPKKRPRRTLTPSISPQRSCEVRARSPSSQPARASNRIEMEGHNEQIGHGRPPATPMGRASSRRARDVNRILSQTIHALIEAAQGSESD